MTSSPRPTPKTPPKLRVRRRWLPWHNRSRRWVSRAWDLVPDVASGDDPISMVLFVLCLPLMIPALLLTPIYLLECALQWVLTPFAALLRLVGAMDVEIVARSWWLTKDARRVRGWTAATCEKHRWARDLDARRRHAQEQAQSQTQPPAGVDPHPYGVENRIH